MSSIHRTGVCNDEQMPRRYEQRKRADQQEETRQRIVQAAVELHELLGPARTSLSAVAERAGVQRNTLYRHFPDEQSLTLACSGLFLGEHPLPDPKPWAALVDPLERARHALEELYAYWESTEAMTANVLRDAELHEPTRLAVRARMEQPLSAIRAAIVAAWPVDRPCERLLAAVELATAFSTWQSLVRRSGLTSADAADLMADAIATVGSRLPTAPRA